MAREDVLLVLCVALLMSLIGAHAYCSQVGGAWCSAICSHHLPE